MLGDGTALDVFNFIIDTPFVVVTGERSAEVAVEAIKGGAADYLVKNADHSHLAVLPTVIDMTIKHASNEQQAKMLSKAMMSISDGVYITNTAGRVIYVNESFLKTYGYSETEILGQTSEVLLGRRLPAGQTAEDEFFHKRKNGTEFPVSLSRSVVKNPEGKESVRITVVHDLTERKKMEEALLEAIDKYAALLELVENKNMNLEMSKRELE